jgi:hypothetical protein
LKTPRNGGTPRSVNPGLSASDLSPPIAAWGDIAAGLAIQAFPQPKLGEQLLKRAPVSDAEASGGFDIAVQVVEAIAG